MRSLTSFEPAMEMDPFDAQSAGVLAQSPQVTLILILIASVARLSAASGQWAQEPLFTLCALDEPLASPYVSLSPRRRLFIQFSTNLQ